MNFHGNVKSKLFPLNLKNKTTIKSDITKKGISHSLRNTNKQTYIYKRKLLIIKDCMDCSHSFTTKQKNIPFSADYWVVQGRAGRGARIHDICYTCDPSYFV